MHYKVSFKERLYFTIMLLVGIGFYSSCASILLKLPFPTNPEHLMLFYIYTCYFTVFMLYRWIYPLWLKGYLISYGIKLTPEQFPEYYQVVQAQAALLKLRKIPSVYLLQAGGILNAFALSIYGKNIIV
jgi:Zn-dependent protease with chaperone function